MSAPANLPPTDHGKTDAVAKCVALGLDPYESVPQSGFSEGDDTLWYTERWRLHLEAAPTLPAGLPPLPPVPPGFDRWEYRGIKWSSGKYVQFAYWPSDLCEGWRVSTGVGCTAAESGTHYLEAVRDEPPHPSAPLESLEGLENLRYYEGKAFTRSFKVGCDEPANPSTREVSGPSEWLPVEMKWQCPACGGYRATIQKRGEPTAFCIKRMIDDHIKEGCAAYGHDEPAKECKPMPDALNKVLGERLFDLMDEPAKDQPADWPCQDLMGGRGAAIYASEDGRCSHPGCRPPAKDQPANQSIISTNPRKVEIMDESEPAKDQPASGEAEEWEFCPECQDWRACKYGGGCANNGGGKSGDTTVEPAPATESKGCEGETPLTDAAERKWVAWGLRIIEASSRGSHLDSDDPEPPRPWEVARDLERKLAERDRYFRQAEESRVANAALYDVALRRLHSSERARRSLSDATDHLNARLRAEQAKLAEARTALEAITKQRLATAMASTAAEALARIDANA